MVVNTSKYRAVATAAVAIATLFTRVWYRLHARHSRSQEREDSRRERLRNQLSEPNARTQPRDEGTHNAHQQTITCRWTGLVRQCA